jgi:rieske iron-sulfur protein
MVTPTSDGRSSLVSSTAQSEDLYRAHWLNRQAERLASRRRILRWVIRVGAGAFGLALLVPALALRSLTRTVDTVTAGDLLVYAIGDQAGLPIEIAALAPGTAVQAFPEGKSENEQNLIELVRLGDDPQGGLVAYSAICTHLGCTVLEALNPDGNIVCPCHASVFDPRADAQVLNGPAARPLPAIPVNIADGRVLAAGSFDAPIGPA